MGGIHYGQCPPTFVSVSVFVFMSLAVLVSMIYFTYDPGELLTMYSKLELPIVVARIHRTQILVTDLTLYPVG